MRRARRDIVLQSFRDFTGQMNSGSLLTGQLHVIDLRGSRATLESVPSFKPSSFIASKIDGTAWFDVLGEPVFRPVPKILRG